MNSATRPANGINDKRKPICDLSMPSRLSINTKVEPKKVNCAKTVFRTLAIMLHGRARSFSAVVGSGRVISLSVWATETVIFAIVAAIAVHQGQQGQRIASTQVALAIYWQS